MKKERTGVSVFASHGLVLLHLVQYPDTTMREMAQEFSLSERRIARILSELREAGLIQIRKNGKRNLYDLNKNAGLMHPTLTGLRLGDLLRATEPDSSENLRHMNQENPGLFRAVLLPFAVDDFEILCQLLPAFV
jgi:DNA-binding IscR family transcriptional regulator